ncbi:MAG: hypothetical protein Q7S45_04850 [Candidatus Curtissbacteria bacterium]|nr:hypothetical protein [Candidatus Curtissbacteria bacterium]
MKYSEMDDESLIQHIKDGIGPGGTAAAQSELMKRWLSKLNGAVSKVESSALSVSSAVDELHKTIKNFNKQSARSTKWIIVLTIVMALLASAQIIVSFVN